MRKIIFLSIFVLSLVSIFSGCLSSSYSELPPDKIPPCIAVTTFENRSGFSGRWELGRGMSDLLVSELVKTKRFISTQEINMAIVGQAIGSVISAASFNLYFFAPNGIRNKNIEIPVCLTIYETVFL